MKKLRTAIAQINTTVGDFEGNTRKIVENIKEARDTGANLIVFPELTLCGYPPEDLLLKDSFAKENHNWLKKIISETEGITAVVGYVMKKGRWLFNAAALISDGSLMGNYAKHHLPNYGVFDEKRYFSGGKGFLLFEICGFLTGINICEDSWIKKGPVSALAKKGGTRIILNLSASPFHAGKINTRIEMLSRQCNTNGVYIIYCNLVGGQDEVVFDGGSLVISPDGSCLLRGPLFCETLLFHDFLPDESGCVRNKLPEGYRLISLPEIETVISKRKVSSGSSKPLDELEEVYEALVLGTRDYVRKNGFERVVIGISGGIDSSLTVAVAVESMGSDNVVGVTMPSVYSSEGTKDDAVFLAENLGIEFHTIPIQGEFEKYLEELKDISGDMPPDVADENLQARIRGNILMFLSNKFGWLVLTTGNKSEVSVGYCTLYGDTAGGFAPLKDVPKTMVWQLSEFVNARSGREIIPRSIIDRPPSAELRPDQKDQDSLPPYGILDGILKLYIEKDCSYRYIVEQGYDPVTVRNVINLVDRSEYKRRQSPPGVKITPKAFGRDRRLPITNKFRLR